MRYILAFCAVVALSSNSATAQTICSPREGIVGRLAEKYGEVPVGIGVTNKGDALVELLTTKDGLTWTIIVSMSNGTACVVAAGEGWRFLKPNYTKFDPQT